MLFDDLTTGFLIIFIVVLVFLLVSKPIFAKVSLSVLGENIRSTLKIFFLTSIVLSLLSLPIVISTNVNNGARDYLKFKNADVNGIIHSKEKYYSESQAGEIFSKTNSFFINYLPLRYEIGEYNNSNYVFVNYNVENSKSFVDSNDDYSEFKELKGDEAIVSKKLAENLNWKDGDEITFKIKNSNYTIKIKSIKEENGLIGFDMPLESIGFEKKGSIYVNKDFFGIENGKYNSILLKTSSNEYSKSTLEREVNFIIKGISNDLNFEESRQTIAEKMVIGSNDISLSQILLFVAIIFALPILLVIINDLTNGIKSKKDLFTALQTSGLSEFSIIRIGILKSAIVLLISIIPSVLINLIILFLFSFANINFINLNQDYYNILSLSSQFEGMSFAVIILILIFIMAVSTTLSEFKTGEISQFSFRKQSLFLFGIFIGVLLLLYSFSGYPENQNEKNLYFYIGFISLSFSILRILSLAYPARFKLFTNLALITTFTLSFVAVFSGDFVDKSPFIILFYAANIISLVFVFVVNYDFILRKFARFVRQSNTSLIMEMSRSELFRINYSLLGRFIFMIFVTLAFILVSPISVYFKLEIDKSSFNFDIVVNDKLGDTVTKAGKDTSTESFSFGEVKIKEFTYGKLKQGLENPQTIAKDDENYIDSISTVNQKQASNLILGDGNELDFEKFTNEYVLLGQNYLATKSDDNIRPDLKVDDEITIQFHKGLEVKRKVLGFINENKNPESLIPSLNGIFISFDDYKNLQTKENLNLNTVYGYAFDENESMNNFLASIQNLPVASISKSKENLEISKLIIDYIAIVSFIVLVFMYVIYISLSRLQSIWSYIFMNLLAYMIIVYVYISFSNVAKIYGIEFESSNEKSIIVIVLLTLFGMVLVSLKNIYESKKNK